MHLIQQEALMGICEKVYVHSQGLMFFDKLKVSSMIRSQYTFYRLHDLSASYLKNHHSQTHLFESLFV